MRTRAITVDQVRELIRYESETGDLYRTIDSPRYQSKHGEPLRHVTDEGYRSVYFGKVRIMAHRIAWALHYGEWPNKGIDHINGDKADNRIENLRLADDSENQCNTKARGPLGFKGLRATKNGRWAASIRKMKKTKYLGTFDTPDEAAHAYNKAAIVLFGEFATLNPVGSK